MTEKRFSKINRQIKWTDYTILLFTEDPRLYFLTKTFSTLSMFNITVFINKIQFYFKFKINSFFCEVFMRFRYVTA